jgi:hypothetical protein
MAHVECVYGGARVNFCRPPWAERSATNQIANTYQFLVLPQAVSAKHYPRHLRMHLGIGTKVRYASTASEFSSSCMARLGTPPNPKSYYRDIHIHKEISCLLLVVHDTKSRSLTR